MWQTFLLTETRFNFQQASFAFLYWICWVKSLNFYPNFLKNCKHVKKLIPQVILKKLLITPKLIFNRLPVTASLSWYETWIQIALTTNKYYTVTVTYIYFFTELIGSNVLILLPYVLTNWNIQTFSFSYETIFFPDNFREIANISKMTI